MKAKKVRRLARSFFFLSPDDQQEIIRELITLTKGKIFSKYDLLKTIAEEIYGTDLQEKIEATKYSLQFCGSYTHSGDENIIENPEIAEHYRNTMARHSLGQYLAYRHPLDEEVHKWWYFFVPNWNKTQILKQIAHFSSIKQEALLCYLVQMKSHRDSDPALKTLQFISDTVFNGQTITVEEDERSIFIKTLWAKEEEIKWFKENLSKDDFKKWKKDMYEELPFRMLRKYIYERTGNIRNVITDMHKAAV